MCRLLWFKSCRDILSYYFTRKIKIINKILLAFVIVVGVYNSSVDIFNLSIPTIGSLESLLLWLILLFNFDRIWDNA